MNATIPVSIQLLGRVVNSLGEPLDGKGPIEGTVASPVIDLSSVSPTPVRPNQLFETGIKPIDLLSPLVRGGIHALYADAGVGKLVTVEEIMHSVQVRETKNVVICLGLHEGVYETNDLMDAIHEAGIDARAVTVFEQVSGSHETAMRVVQTGLSIAAYLHEQGYRALLVADQRISEEGILTHLGAVRPIAAQLAVATILQGSLETYHRYQQDGTLGNLDAYVAFNGALFQRKIYPAIDPLQTASRLLSEGIVGQEHIWVVQQVQQLLKKYYALRETQGELALANFAADEQLVLRRGQRIEYFLTQPYVVAEPYTDIPGEYVGLDETIDGLSKLLTGQYDDVPIQAFWMVGDLDQALAKAKA